MPRASIAFVIALFFPMGSALGQGTNGSKMSERPAVQAVSLQDESWKQEVFVLWIGGGARFRKIRLEVGDGTGGTENRSLDTGTYFDVGWHLLIRPLGRSSPRPTVRAVVLQVDGGASVGFDVEPAGSGISLRANTWRMVGQLGYLVPRDRVQFGGLAGVGGDVFNIDLNSVLPSSRIVYVRFGPAASYDIIRGFLRVRGDFGFRFPFALGSLADAFGQDSRAFGMDSVLTLDGRIRSGFTYGFRVVWEYYKFRFAGAVDDVPAMGDGGSGHDNALNLQLLVGWSL